MSDASAQGLRWEEGVPVSLQFDDPYYSRGDGLAETRFVFLEGCDLSARWKDCEDFQIAELGFGTGLNFCAALTAWRQRAETGTLRFTSFELYPLTSDEMKTALAAWPELEGIASELLDVYDPSGGAFTLADAELELIIGDARTQVPAWERKADAWFLDGFAPSRNPELWEPDLIAALGNQAAPGATFATYSAAGAVRRALSAAGLEVERRPGFGTKREMLVARKPR